MKTVFSYITSKGDVFKVDAYDFKWLDFKNITVVSGDKYYVDKAVRLGATGKKPPPTVKVS